VRERNEYTATFRIVRDDGEVRTLLSRGKAFKNGDGEPVRLVGIVMDITRERQAQEALAKAEKFAVAGRMAASVAHEINNPLAAASGLVYLCRTDERVPGDVQQRLDAVEQELQRAAQITRSTLGFYRESPHPTEIDLGALVESVLELQEGSIRKLGIEVQKELRSSEPIRTFAGELRQIFTNLISNAVDAMGANGKLSIRVHPARDWRTGRSGYSVVVVDNGPGIPNETRKKLFQAFHTTKGEKGTGLGLWITKQLIEKHGGSIKYKTRCRAPEHTGGTVFCVWLPLKHGFLSSVGATQEEQLST
jgi:signal transduction histidine kinase